MTKTKPSVDDILELYTETKRIYDPLFEQFDTDEKYYELDFRDLLFLPKEFKPEGVVLPTARDMVDACCDNTDITNARVFVNRKGAANTSDDEVELLRKLYLGLIHRTNVESSLSPWRISDKHFWLYGRAVFQTVWDKNRGNGDYALPLVIKAIHPRCAMPDPYNDDPEFFFEIQERPVAAMKTKYPDWGNPQDRKGDEKVELIRYWTPDFRCDLLDKEPILKGKVAKHNYGFIPYSVIDTGLGNVTADNDLQKRCVGILRYIKDILASESRDYSISDIVLKRSSFPWGTIEGTGAERVGKLDQQFGAYNPLPDGVKVINQVPQVPPQALNEHLAISASYISGHAAPNVVRGMGEGGVRAASDRRLLLAQASARYKYATEAFQNGTAKVLINCARLVKNVIPEDAIHVWAKTPADDFDIEIDKKKMTEPFTCYVEFSPNSEEEEYARHDDLERLTQSGIVTRKWARTQMSNVDPKAMEIEEELQVMKNDPAVRQVISQYLMGKIAQALNKRDLAEQAKSGEPILPNPGLAPPAMNVRQQPTNPAQPGGNPAMSPTGIELNPPIPQTSPGQELQNRLAGMRSQTPMSATQGRGIGAGGNR